MQTLGNVGLCVAGFQCIKKNTFVWKRKGNFCHQKLKIITLGPPWLASQWSSRFKEVVWIQKVTFKLRKLHRFVLVILFLYLVFT